MVRNRTKKYRGTHYGRGMKSGRGKGKRGGSGMAGLGKHKWIWMVKYDPLHYGGKGFTSHHFSRSRPVITLGQLESSISDLKDRGFISQTGEVLEIDLKTAGYGKLLGSGTFSLKARIVVPKATEKALSKISAIGSTVELDE